MIPAFIFIRLKLFYNLRKQLGKKFVNIFHSTDSRGISSTTLYIILGIATGIIVILLAVVLVVVFRRRDSAVTNSPDRSKKGYVKGNVKGGNQID